MTSKYREVLKEFSQEKGIFIGMVQMYDPFTKHLIINDLRVMYDGKFRKISPHLHIKHCRCDIWLGKFDILTFKANVCSYDKSTDDGKFENYSLCNVSDIRKVEGKYNGK